MHPFYHKYTRFNVDSLSVINVFVYTSKSVSSTKCFNIMIKMLFDVKGCSSDFIACEESTEDQSQVNRAQYKKMTMMISINVQSSNTEEGAIPSVKNRHELESILKVTLHLTKCQPAYFED